MAKKTSKPVKPRDDGSDELGIGLHGLAKVIDGIGEELRPIYHLEQLAENVGGLHLPLNKLADAIAMYVIAQHSGSQDRDAAVAYLKRWFDDFPKE